LKASAAPAWTNLSARGADFMKTPLDRHARTRTGIAFLLLLVFVVALSLGARFITDLGKLQESIATRESQTALRGITDPSQIDQELRRHPSNKILQLTATARKAALETGAASEKLLGEVEPPTLAKDINPGKASRGDLEALRRDLKTAEANATAFMPRYIVLMKTERDKVETYALALRLEKDIVARVLNAVDGRHAQLTALTSEMLSARSDYYRTYAGYVGVLIAEFGTYRVENGQLIFPLQRTVDRYSVAAHALTVAAKRQADLEQQRNALLQSQQEGWEQLVNGK
jgi:hypothetical protein